MYYNASNADGCSATNFTSDFSGDPDGILTPIFLVDRGNCTFVTKVRNIERAGGSLAVIIDDTGATDVKNIVMSDDGTGTGIRIPAMLISQRDGKALKDFLLGQPADVASQAALAAEFVLENQDNAVKWELWYTTANDRALDFLKNMGLTANKLAKVAEFQPRIVTWACPSCDADFKRKECVSNGRYCAMNHKGAYVQGRDILMEDLRQVCLFKGLKAQGRQALWWTYVIVAHRLCYDEITEECSKNAHQTIQEDYAKTMQCVAGSFTGSNFQQDDNTLLAEEARAWKEYGVGYWPSVVINGRTYRGDLVPDAVQNALCAAFAVEPQECREFKVQQGVENEPEGITGNVLIAVVVLLVLVNVLMIFLYRRCTKRDMKDDMQLRVNSAVSQYFALSTRNNTA